MQSSPTKKPNSPAKRCSPLRNAPSFESRKATLIALAAILIYVCLFYVLANSCFAYSSLDDDFAISSHLSGRNELTTPCLFINALLSYAIIGLNATIPNLNWFYAFAALSTFVAFCLFAYYTITRLSFPLALIACANIFFLMIAGCTYDDNFTFFSGMCSLAGFFVLALPFAGHRVGKPGIAIAGLLCIIGFCFRFESFLLVSAFFAIAVALLMLFARSKERTLSPRNRRQSWKAFALKLLPVVLLLALVGSLYAFDRQTWNTEPNASWKTSNGARSMLSDYPCKEYDEIAEELSAIGISKNDYAMLMSWQTADPTVFNTQTIQKVAEIATTDSDIASMCSNAIPRISFWASVSPLHTAGVILILLLESLFIVLTRNRKARFLLIASIAFACLVSLYFIVLGRFPERIQNIVWASALAFPIVLSLKDPSAAPQPGFPAILPVISIVFTGLMLVYCVGTPVATLDSSELAEKVHQDQIHPQSEFMDFVRNGDNIVVTDVEATLYVEALYKKRNIPETAFFEKISSTGGWGTNSPACNAFFQRIGQTGAIPSLLAENVLFCQIPGSGKEQYLLTFLQEHYDPGVTCATISIIDDSTADTCFEIIRFIPSSAASNGTS